MDHQAGVQIAENAVPQQLPLSDEEDESSITGPFAACQKKQLFPCISLV